MKTIIEGARKLLIESLSLLGHSKEDVIIVGGWGPYLRHQDIHPGTKDVDILFPESYSKEQIQGLLEHFLDNDFFINAKHDFQLCRAYQIGNRRYIYNVDLLHPTEGKINKVDFINIMDLDITVDGIIVKPIITINILHGDVMYSEKLFEKVTFQDQTFNVLDGAGIVISKIDSCTNKKRPRDIFDIYLSLKEPNVIEKLKFLNRLNPHLAKAFEKYSSSFETNWPYFEKNLKEFGIDEANAKEILSLNTVTEF
ncbi:nucleotidyl transferase AbiEii/AbiGii toxin family protein [Mucilaginibacter sp.]|uniref:nucleotidyl transferase AbiEii/AbiGii toxin family protein n=1 Tax=Mucilaginibacter sp. TaxID=1882438 RepID=UPI003D0CDBF1